MDYYFNDKSDKGDTSYVSDRKGSIVRHLLCIYIHVQTV